MADARSGDKGSNANIGIIARSEEFYQLLQKHLTAEKVQAFFAPLQITSSTRYELPNLLALNFVLKDALDGGGSRSLRLDPQGKALGQTLLEMFLELPEKEEEKKISFVLTAYPHPRICQLTLNRPEKRNALHIPLLKEMCSILHDLKKNPELRVLLIASTPPSFCAGMDLKEAADPLLIEESSLLIAEMFRLILDFPCATLAVASGSALGGGAGILSACDLVIADTTLTIGYPETSLGLVPAQVAPLLYRLLPLRQVNELLLIGTPVRAEQAFDMGLINKVVQPEELLAEALVLAQDLEKKAPEAMKQTKKLLNELDRQAFSAKAEIALRYHAESRLSSEAKEGSTAFNEKRLPGWVK